MKVQDTNARIYEAYCRSYTAGATGTVMSAGYLFQKPDPDPDDRHRFAAATALGVRDGRERNAISNMPQVLACVEVMTGNAREPEPYLGPPEDIEAERLTVVVFGATGGGRVRLAEEIRARLPGWCTVEVSSPADDAGLRKAREDAERSANRFGSD